MQILLKFIRLQQQGKNITAFFGSEDGIIQNGFHPFLKPLQFFRVGDPGIFNAERSAISGSHLIDKVPQAAVRFIDLADLGVLLTAYKKCYGDPKYLPAADFNNDGCVELADLGILLAVYKHNCPTR